MLVGVLGGLLLVGLLWIVVTGLMARSRLDGLRPELRHYRSALASGDLDRAGEIGRRIEARTDSAHQLTSGPAWWVGSHVLVAGTPLRTTREVSFVLNRLSHSVLPSVPELVAHADPDAERDSAAHADLANLQAADVRVARLRGLVREGISAVRAAPASWLGPVGGGRDEVLTGLASVDAGLGGVHRAVDTLVPMLGADRPQRYFLGFMNEAEARAIGGLPGAFAIVTVDDGHVGIEHIGNDTELIGVRADIDLGAEYNALYDEDDPTGVIQNSDIGPNFPDTARIWAGMWQAKTGEHVDGALAVDPSALGYLLRATGPTRLPDGTAVTADNIAGLTQSRQYVLYPGYQAAQATERKQFLATIAQAVSAKLLHLASPTRFIAPLRQALHEHRIVVWSDDPSHERAIADVGIGGVLRPGHAPFSGFVVTNAAGGKMDFYLHRSMTYRTSGCGAGRIATATFTLRNETPHYRLPAYVTYVSGGRPAGQPPGFNRSIVAYYATPGATIRSVELDGRPLRLTPAAEDSLTSIRTGVDLPAGAQRTLTVSVREPATTGPVQILRQPLVYPVHVRTSGPSCTATPTDRRSVGVWPVVVGVLLLLAAGAVVTRRRITGGRPVSDDPASGTGVR